MSGIGARTEQQKGPHLRKGGVGMSLFRRPGMVQTYPVDWIPHRNALRRDSDVNVGSSRFREETAFPSWASNKDRQRSRGTSYANATNAIPSYGTKMYSEDTGPCVPSGGKKINIPTAPFKRFVRIRTSATLCSMTFATVQ